MTAPPPSSPTSDLDELLVHRPPMRWVDEVVAIGEREVHARVHPKPTSLYVEAGAIPIIYTLEWMAQAIAVWGGARDRRKEAEGRDARSREGYLVAIPSAEFECESLAPEGCFDIRTSLIWDNEDAAAFQGEVFRDEVRVAKARMSIVRRDGRTPLSSVAPSDASSDSSDSSDSASSES